MKRFFRKLFGRDTGKIRYEAHRENLHRACDANIAETAKTLPPRQRIRSTPKLRRFHGPESV